MDLVCADPRSMHGYSSSCRHKSVCLLVATVPVFVSRYGASTISRWQRLWSSPCLCRLWRRWQWQNQPWRHPTPPTGLSYCWWDDVQFNKNTISTFEWIKILKVNGFYFINGFYKANWLSYGFNCSIKLSKLLKNYIVIVVLFLVQCMIRTHCSPWARDVDATQAPAVTAKPRTNQHRLDYI